VQAEFPKYKDQGLKLGEASGYIAQAYKALPADQLAAWKQKADELSGRTARASQQAGPKKTTGYNLFVKEHMPQLKARVPEGQTFAAHQAMAELGSLWKSLPEDQREAYKDRATQHNQSIKE